MNLGAFCLLASSFPALAAFAPAAPALPTEYTAKVAAVQEGDIIKIEHDGKIEKVRLWGIDCPEMNQQFATKSKKFTSDLILGQTVTLRVLEIDRYKRPVAFVLLPDGRNLNHELVRAGLAWWFVRYAPKDTALEKLEADAKTNKRGLWSAENPTPPWEHRKRQRGPDY